MVEIPPAQRGFCVFLLPFLAGLALVAACSGKESEGPKPTSVLLLTLDTTRTDALSCYGAHAPTTPNLDSLAAESILFEHAFTSAPITLPAHASIFTGLYPLRHGLRDNGQGALATDAQTLAELAKENGYQTAAFVAAVVLDATFGLAQGFDLYDAPKRMDPEGGEPGPDPKTADPTGAGDTGDKGDKPERHAERPAREVADAALSWLGNRDRSKPFFVWCHFYDPHTPYTPPADLEPKAMDLTFNMLPEYLREIRGMDREIGRLLAGLRADGTLSDTIVLVVGDHGEAFGEHFEIGHGILCHGATLQAPLILRLPENRPSGRRSGERSQAIASVVDVLPTLAGALGWKVSSDPDGLDGIDLLDAPPTDRGVYFESYSGYLSYGWSPLAGWLDAGGKYIHGSEPTFFDWKSDPKETVLIPAGEDDERLRPYRSAIAELASKKTFVAESAGADLLDDLRGLGYASVGAAPAKFPQPLEATGLPAPEKMWELYQESLRALTLAQAGSIADAEAVFVRVLEVNPKNAFVLEQLANCQVQSGRPEEACETLRRLLRETPAAESPRAWFKLGQLLRVQGKFDEAIQALRRADELAPNRRSYMRELLSALRDAGKTAEADSIAKRLRILSKG